MIIDQLRLALRPIVVLLSGSLIVMLAACDQGGDADADGEVEDLTIVVEQDKSRIVEEESALDQKRSQLLSEQERVQKEREEIKQKLASLSQKDRKQREQLEAEQARLEASEAKLRQNADRVDVEREKLEKEKTALLKRITSLTQRSTGGMTIEQREGLMAQREKDLAKREAALAEREAALARRESQVTQILANAESAIAGLQGQKTVVMTAPPAATSSGATRNSAKALQSQSRSKMSKKGLLMEDLPPTARELFQQGNRAYDSKDYDGASAAFTQFQAMVERIAIDGRFIELKMGRLNRIAQSAKLGPAQEKKKQTLFQAVSDATLNGRYVKANRKANELIALLQGK